MNEYMNELLQRGEIRNRIKVRWAEYDPNKTLYDASVSEKEGLPVEWWIKETNTMFHYIESFIAKEAYKKYGEGTEPIIANLWIGLDKVGAKMQLELDIERKDI